MAHFTVAAGMNTPGHDEADRREADRREADGWPPSRLWDMVAALYPAPGVAETCLDLQDRRGIDVCLLLLAVWCGREGLHPDAAAAHCCRAEAAHWAGEVVRPLRGVRRRLKARLEVLGAADLAAPVGDVRQRLAAAEIGLERAELILLERCVANLAATTEPGADAAFAAMQALTNLCSIDRAEVDTLLEAVFAERPAR